MSDTQSLQDQIARLKNMLAILQVRQAQAQAQDLKQAPPSEQQQQQANGNSLLSELAAVEPPAEIVPPVQGLFDAQAPYRNVVHHPRPLPAGSYVFQPPVVPGFPNVPIHTWDESSIKV